MRKSLDTLYLGSGVAAGCCLAIMALLIMAQIIGRWFDVVIPSTEDFSGFLLAAASFLAMAYTFRAGGHIRVNLFIRHIHGRPKTILEAIILTVALALASYIAWYSILLVIESYQFEELSQGYIAVPLWIPQLPMAVGLTILVIALIDDLTLILTDQKTGYMRHDELDNQTSQGEQ